MNAAGRYIFRNGAGAAEFIRFCIIGTLAAAVHYGIYYLLLLFGVNDNISYASGYVISFIGNFFATSYFTFRTKPSWGRFAGFAGSHGVNFLIHMVLLNVFLYLGMHRLIAPVFVMLVAMVVQFIILRFVFHYRRRRQDTFSKDRPAVHGWFCPKRVKGSVREKGILRSLNKTNTTH